MPVLLVCLKAMVIAVWSAVLVGSVTLFTLRWTSLHWTDAAYPILAVVAGRELLVWVFEA